MHRDLLVLDQRITAADRAIRICTQHSLIHLEQQDEPREALLWNMTVQGEAAGQLSAELRDAHPDIPWRNATALRNRIVHGDWSVDLPIIHATAVHDFPAFSDQFTALLADLERRD